MVWLNRTYFNIAPNIDSVAVSDVWFDAIASGSGEMNNDV